ncbi:MAG: glucans biosynthesis glucosyltransferase MdoH, partial [Bryobacteraceae bacterium]
MDTLTQQSRSQGGAQEPFLPAESPLPMSTQQLRSFEPSKGEASAALTSTGFRRACIFAGTGVLTAGGCYEMYEVLQVGGVTVLEWMVLVLFVLLFAWVAFSFMSALAGFAVLLFRARDPLGIDPDAPLPQISSGNAMLLPTYNEDPGRIMARLRAMHESVD